MMNLMEQLPFLQNFPPVIQSIIVNLILLIVAIVMILILRKVLMSIIIRPLRALARRTPIISDELIVEEIVSPLRIAIVGLSLIITVNLINFGAEIQQIAETLARTFMIGAGFYALLKIYDVVSLRPELFKRITGLTIPERLLPFLNSLIKSLLIILGAIFILQELSFDVAALIASLGVVGIGISLASQDTVSNLFGFAAIVTDNPFEVGDFIKTPDVTGIVEKVGMRSTRVRQLDQALVAVPNNLLTNAVVLNWSRLEKRRLNFTIGLTYDASSQQIRALIQHIRDLLDKTEDVNSDSIVVHFVELGASSLDILVIAQILLPDWGEYTALKEDLYLEIMEIVEKLGLSFAFPSQSLYIESMPGVKTPQTRVTQEQRAMLQITEQEEESHQEDGTGDVDDQVGDEPDQK
jgi:MscS family membrane protein